METATAGLKAPFQKIARAVPKESLKQRIVLIILFAVLVCLYVLVFMPRTTFSYIDRTGEVVDVGEITADRPFSQEVQVKDGVLKGIEIDFHTYDRRNHAEYVVDFLDSGGNLLASSSFNADKLAEDGPFAVPLPQIPVQAGEAYTVRISSADASEGNALGVDININGKNKNAPAAADGGELAGSLRMRLGYESWSPDICIAAAILIAAVSVAILFWGKKLHVNVLVLALIFGVMFSLITPITDTPDEQVHTATAFIMADGNLVTKSGELAPTTKSINRVMDNHMRRFNHNTLGRAVSEKTTESSWGSGRLFFGFLPQTIGLWFAKLLHTDLKGYFYMGRIFNALAYAIFAFFAVKKAPKYKLYMAVLALMPMSLVIAGSYNPDAVTYGLALLMGAWFIDMYFNQTYKISWKQIGIFAVIAALLMTIKFSLCALALLPLFIPAARYKDRKTKWLGSAVILAASAVAAFLAVWWMSASSAGTSALSGDELSGRGANAMQQLSFLLHNPGAAASIFSKTIMRDLGDNLMQLFGLGQLTYSVFGVVAIVYFAFLALVAFAYTKYEYQPELAKGYTPVSLLNRGMILFVILLSILLAYLALYLTWTPVSADTVEGVQGRYFVPLFFLLPFIGQNVYPVVEKGAYGRAQVNIQFMVVLFAAVALLTTLVRFY